MAQKYTESQADFHARMERQFQNYVRDGSYEWVPDAQGNMVRRKRRKNVKKVRQLIDVMKKVNATRM